MSVPEQLRRIRELEAINAQVVRHRDELGDALAASEAREAPEFPFHIDTQGVDCHVVLDPNLTIDGEPVEGAVKVGYDYQTYIALRAYDERVLLHEVLHVVCRKNRKLIEEWLAGDGFHNEEEGLVRALTAALFGMGWRWRGIDRDAAIMERDMRRAYDAANEDRAKWIDAEAREARMREQMAKRPTNPTGYALHLEERLAEAEAREEKLREALEATKAFILAGNGYHSRPAAVLLKTVEEALSGEGREADAS